MSWSSKPIKTGWYVVYRNGTYDTWHFHPAHDDIPNRFLGGISCRKGELCYGPNPDKDLFSVTSTTTMGEKFFKLPEPVNA